MKNALTQTIVATGISVLSFSALADTTLFTSQKSVTNSPQLKGMAECVGAIRGYHDSEAKLFINNKASSRDVGDSRVFTVKGWVWRDGERVQVTHHCAAADGNKVALRIQYTGEEQFASN